MKGDWLFPVIVAVGIVGGVMIGAGVVGIVQSDKTQATDAVMRQLRHEQAQMDLQRAEVILDCMRLMPEAAPEDVAEAPPELAFEHAYAWCRRFARGGGFVGAE